VRLVPSRFFLTKGVGRHRERLSSYELALRSARIAEYNLVHVSSIVPPGCRLISRAHGINELMPGQIVFSVLAKSDTSEPNRLISASIGVAIPRDRTKHGYLSEHHSHGMTERKSSDYAEDLAASMLATTLGLPFDVDESWDSRKQQWKFSGEIVKTKSMTQSAEGEKNGLWTTVLAAAVFVLDDL
jgi:arginine decarboxylase